MVDGSGQGGTKGVGTTGLLVSLFTHSNMSDKLISI